MDGSIMACEAPWHRVRIRDCASCLELSTVLATTFVYLQDRDTYAGSLLLTVTFFIAIGEEWRMISVVLIM